MIARPPRFFVPVLSVGLLCSVAGTAWSQQPRQLLERHAVHNDAAALELDLPGSGATGPGISNYGLTPASGFSVCQLHPTRGLYCLRERQVRRWEDPRDGGAGSVEFSCADAALGLDDRADACSTLAVGRDGSVWISGLASGAYRIIRVLEKQQDGPCAEGAPLASAPRYCFRQYAGGQQRMLRLLVVDRGEAAAFDPGTGQPTGGVLGLDRLGAVRLFGPGPSDAPRLLVPGRAGWGVSGSVQVLDLALLQVADGARVDNFLLATDSAGAVRARQTDFGAPTTPRRVYQSPTAGIGLPGPPYQRCSTTPQRYGLAASSAASAGTGQVYLTDRNYCVVTFLRPSDGDDTDADDAPFDRLVPVRRDGEDLVLSTVAYPSSVPPSYPPDGATRAPGVIVDLEECEGSCVLRRDEAGQPVARLFEVRRSTSPSLMHLQQAVFLPDCRYLPDDPVCVGRDSVIGPDDDPGAQYFDLSKVLPQDILDQFPGAGGVPPELPPLLLPPHLRAQQSKDFRFGLFFGITPPGTTFVGTFQSEWDVAGLSGAELGCELGYPRFSPLAELLSQDVVATVSERYIAAGGPRGVVAPAPGDPDLRYVATIVNNGCGSTRGGGVRWSAYAYDLEITHLPTRQDDQDDVYADLLERLFSELEVTQRDIACRPAVDSPDSLPLSPPECDRLDRALQEAGVRLGRCLAAARYREPALLPPPGSVDFYCSRFLEQLRRYRAELSRIPAGSPEDDPANRIGELGLRGEVFEHLFIERFLPSVPERGFTVP